MAIDPFGVTVEAVAALIPEATIPETRQPGQKAVVVADVTAWLQQFSAEADLRLAGWTGLPDGQRDQVTAVAARLVTAAAASYVEAARAPERAGPADTSYAQVLWDRWVTGLPDLAGLVETWLDGDPATTPTGGVAAFPAPVIPDLVTW